MRIDSILILAAGKGTRLKPFTNHVPKSLLPLGHTNILRNLIEQSMEYFTGVKIYVNVSYLAEKIIKEINNFPITIRPYIIWEQHPLGPAFTVTNHCNEINGNVLVIHGDNFFSDLAYSKFANSINQKKQDVSVLLCHLRERNAARSLVIENDGIIKSIFEVPISDSSENVDQSANNDLVWSSSGVLVIKKGSLLNFIPDKGESLSPRLINHIASRGELELDKCTGARISIDNEKSYLSAIEISQISENLFILLILK
jgi:NDP-sugar pyrophosphorylase family protein